MSGIIDRAIEAEERADELAEENARLRRAVYQLLGDGDVQAGFSLTAFIARATAAENLVNEIPDVTMPAAGFRLPDGWESRARALMAAASTADKAGGAIDVIKALQALNEWPASSQNMFDANQTVDVDEGTTMTGTDIIARTSSRCISS